MSQGNTVDQPAPDEFHPDAGFVSDSSETAALLTKPRHVEPLSHWGRLADRTLWFLLDIALLALAAIAFAIWINASGPLHPVPVASRPSA